MQLNALISSLRDSIFGLPRNLRESLEYLPVLVKRPSSIFNWIKTARAAQISLLLSILLVPTVLPKLMDITLEAVFPPITERKLFGLIERNRTDPRLEGYQKAGRILLYIGAGGIVAVLLLLHLPKTLKAPPVRKHHPAAPANKTIIIGDSPLSQAPNERFQITRLLGRGGMGMVHLARDTVLDRNVALKELHAVFGSDGQLLQRFRQEAKILAQLTHPGIVQIYDFLELEGRFWIVMEYVEGGEFTERLSQGPMPFAEVTRFGANLAESLAFAHDRGVIHRDFKPSNVLITGSGDPKITDFGIARLAQTTSLTQEGTVLGSPHYMSPEQAEGKSADERSDIYSLGVVLYESLKGKPPFDGDTIAAVLAQHIAKEPLPLAGRVPGMSEAFDRFIITMLAKEPGKRIQSMKEAAEFLSASH